MGLFKSKETTQPAVQTVPAGVGRGAPFSLQPCAPVTKGELRMYKALREAVPVIDAAVNKIVRLAGGFTVECEDAAVQRQLQDFLKHVRVNSCQEGAESFVGLMLDQLLTYGTAVGEMVLGASGEEIAALYNASLEEIELDVSRGPFDLRVCVHDGAGALREVAYPQLVLVSALNPGPGEAWGQSILKGLPFVSSILLKIYHSLGLNWERMGNVRFAVTYKPGPDAGEKAYAKERAMQIAREWSKAMQGEHGRVSDFVAVGDVDIKVIGADNQVLDSQVPVRQMLEQIVAKLSIPPFLLGLSWSTTERMSTQQADILTSELEAYRRMLQPSIEKICSLWLRLHGYDTRVDVVWSDINLQDEVECANAKLTLMQAAEIEMRLNREQKGEENS